MNPFTLLSDGFKRVAELFTELLREAAIDPCKYIGGFLILAPAVVWVLFLAIFFPPLGLTLIGLCIYSLRTS